MLGKIAFFFLLALVVYALWRKAQAPKKLEKDASPAVKKMIKCPVCGVHFAEVDGTWGGNRMYCSAECAKKATEAKENSRDDDVQH